jgi:hypothetical protein
MFGTANGEQCRLRESRERAWSQASILNVVPAYRNVADLGRLKNVYCLQQSELRYPPLGKAG